MEIEQEMAICAAAKGGARLAHSEDYVPAMPCASGEGKEDHRPKIFPFSSHSWIVINACVARPVGRKEVASNPAARASMQAECDRLRNKFVWDESKFREWSEVAREA